MGIWSDIARKGAGQGGYGHDMIPFNKQRVTRVSQPCRPPPTTPEGRYWNAQRWQNCPDSVKFSPISYPKINQFGLGRGFVSSSARTWPHLPFGCTNQNGSPRFRDDPPLHTDTKSTREPFVKGRPAQAVFNSFTSTSSDVCLRVTRTDRWNGNAVACVLLLLMTVFIQRFFITSIPLL